MIDGGNTRYSKSESLLTRALRVIPLGSQTFSKSHTQFPRGESPLFLTHGNKGRVWDVDGNEYVDLVCGLLPVLLGYCDPDVDAAIRRQLSRGITLSLATELEIELAERLVEIIPSADAVRFGKNGSDATLAAVRVARAATRRDRIAVAGYHGWHDWFIGTTTRNKGVPRATAELTHRFVYNDLDSLERTLGAHPGEFAAVMMEPMMFHQPRPGYLGQVKELTHRHGAVLIFDEIITGFRFAVGGAQEYFRVTPDLSVFGKGIANGMPLSAVVGRADLMAEMDEIFFSSTFGGETLSLAAAIAVVDKLRGEPIIETIWRTGTALTDGVQQAIIRNGVAEVIEIGGLPPWRLIAYRDHPHAAADSIKTFLMRDLLRHGVLMNGSHNICYAHTADDVAHVVEAYNKVLAALAEALADPRFEDRLGCPVIRPVFAVR